MRILSLFLSLVSLTFSVSAQVIPGAGRPDLYGPLLSNKNIGLVANSASVIDGRNVLDTLLSLNLRVGRVFSPEHGFRGGATAGEEVSNSTDSLTGIPVISLYGKKTRPSPSDLKGIDVMVFDLQDVGVRFYTYISTLTLVLDACAEKGIPVVVFDRPNPNAFYIDGPVLERSDSSFVGMHPVPLVYGMTVGEFARMIAGENWFPHAATLDLTVIPVSGYTHATYYEIPVKPSPNLPDMNAIWLYPSLCLFEGTVISVGRGTCFPFEVFGHPDLKGFSFSFVPQKIPGMSMDPPYLGKTCLGLDLRDFYRSKPRLKGRINLSWLMMCYADLQNNPDFFTPYFDKLAGTRILREQIMAGKNEQEIRNSWRPGLDEFMKIRVKYLLYPE